MTTLRLTSEESRFIGQVYCFNRWFSSVLPYDDGFYLRFLSGKPGVQPKGYWIIIGNHQAIPSVLLVFPLISGGIISLAPDKCVAEFG